MENITRRQALLGLSALAAIPVIGKVAAEEPVEIIVSDGKLLDVIVVLGNMEGDSCLPVIRAKVFSKPCVDSINRNIVNGRCNRFTIMVDDKFRKLVIEHKKSSNTNFSVVIYDHANTTEYWHFTSSKVNVCPNLGDMFVVFDIESVKYIKKLI